MDIPTYLIEAAIPTEMLAYAEYGKVSERGNHKLSRAVHQFEKLGWE
jgi:hypothetical protein